MRARLERGMLQGRKLGSRWVVDSLPQHTAVMLAALFPDAFNTLVDTSDGQASVLSAEERRRAKRTCLSRFRCKGQRLLSDTEPAVG